MPLYEDFRPRVWSDVIGQDKVVSRLQALIAAGRVGGNAFWFSGKSGQGKTTIARLLALEIADSFNIKEVIARKVSCADLEGFQRDSRMFGMGTKNGKAYIVNEAHGLNKEKIECLLGILEPEEPLPSHVVWIFTTTNDGQEKLFGDYDDAAPLLSRCKAFKLSDQGIAKAFAARAQAIAQSVGLDGRPLKDYIALAERCKGNLRSMLQEIESGAMMS